MRSFQKLQQIPRLARFALVGSGCFIVQLTLLKLLVISTGLSPTLANSIGFASSAQLNFALSYQVTWRDSRRLVRLREFIKPWGSYNAATLLALVVNTGVFAVMHNYVGPISSAAIALACGTIFNFGFNHCLTFRHSNPPLQPQAEPAHQ